MAPSHRERVVAFLDILGMRRHLAGPGGGAEFVRSILHILKEVLEPSANDKRLRHIAENRRILSFITAGWTKEIKGSEITSMSDSIVVSFPKNVNHWNRRLGTIFSIYVCMETVFYLQRALLQLGILTRGGISIGTLYHSGPLVVGNGLVSAYEIESQVAIYPRAIIGDRIIDLLITDPIPDVAFIESRIGQLFRRDRDGLYFVDYLGLSGGGTEIDWPDRLAGINKFVEAEAGKTNDLRIKQKWAWLREYVRQSTLWWDDPDIETKPHDTDGPLESRYPRDFTKTRTYQMLSSADLVELKRARRLLAKRVTVAQRFTLFIG